MADHKVTDLSYGHLGKSIYDYEKKSWQFSVDTQHELRVSLVQELKKCIALSPVKSEHEGEPVPSVLAQIQMRWLSKSYPEMLPARESIFPRLKTSAMDSAFAVHEGCLLAVAHAKDTERISGTRRPLILAFPSGESGHILHLIKPKSETRGWRNQTEARLKIFDSGSIEHGFWTGTGGSIRQIASADDEERRTDPWLAVRQDTMITILQPLYGKPPESPTKPISHQEISSSFLLQPNPVVILTPDKTSSRVHVDFSFNPFYPRQFAVIDDKGHWSIWNIENLHAKGNSYVLVPGRSGDLSEDQAKDEEIVNGSSDPGAADGWHKLMWACNVSTIVICRRRRIEVFDVESNPERLHSPDFLPVKGNDWIIDAVRSLKNPDHIFILTTSRIYWIKIIPVGDQDDSTRVLLSYRHFRDPNDDTMRLTPLNDGHVSVTITSAKSPLVNFYSFLTNSSSEVSCQASLTLDYSECKDAPASYFRATCLVPCTYISGKSLSENISFYQLWGLATNSGISTALYAAQRLEPGERSNEIQPPDRRIRHASRGRGFLSIKDDFVVPDELVGKWYNIKRDRSPEATTKEDVRLKFDWSAIFESIFVVDDIKSNLSGITQSMPEILGRLNQSITKGFEEDFMPMDTIANATGLCRSSGALDEAASALRDFLKALNLDDLDERDGETASKLVLSHLTDCPGTKDLLGTDSRDIDLFKVHEQLVKYWITSLPFSVSNLARHSKFKIIRQLGIELSLNSVGISLQNKASSATDNTIIAPEEEVSNFDKENGAATRDSSPGLYFSQPHLAPDQDIYSSLLTPSRTPSVYSHATSATSELREDPVTSRLRQYAISIRARPDPEKSLLLAHWPSQPGVNPATYSFEAIQKQAIAEESGNESEYRNRKEEARRRKRTEKFLRQERARAAGAGSMSQPVVGLPSGSQPGAYDSGFSSQMVDELPMTQPDRGTFGARSVPKVRKQKKHRKAGF